MRPRHIRHVTVCNGIGHRRCAPTCGIGPVLVALTAGQAGLPFEDWNQPLERRRDMRRAEPGRLMAYPDLQDWNRPAAPGRRRLRTPIGFRRNADRLPPGRPEIPRHIPDGADYEEASLRGRRVVLPDCGRRALALSLEHLPASCAGRMVRDRGEAASQRGVHPCPVR